MSHEHEAKRVHPDRMSPYRQILYLSLLLTLPRGRRSLAATFREGGGVMVKSSRLVTLG